MPLEPTISLLQTPASWPNPQPLEARATFPENFPGFDGHFPGHPILPGFAQIQLALDILHRAFPSLGNLLEIPSAKFSRPIHPNEPITLTLQSTPSGLIHVTLTTAAQPASTFDLLLSPPKTQP